MSQATQTFESGALQVGKLIPLHALPEQHLSLPAQSVAQVVALPEQIPCVAGPLADGTAHFGFALTPTHAAQAFPAAPHAP